MDKTGFRTYLESRNVSAEKLDAALDLAERFVQFAQHSIAGFSVETVWAFSRLLIQEGLNTWENFLTLARYGYFLHNNSVYVGFVESLDGGEAQENLYKLVAERFGEVVRDKIFNGIGLAPFGLPTNEKPRYMHPVIERLTREVGENATRDFLSDCLRELGDFGKSGAELFKQCKDIDEYLVRKKHDFIEQLDNCFKQGKLFFAQEITQEVLDYVRNEPEIGGGIRVGNVIFETKIPYMTAQFLLEKDDTLKRYYACHCPWAREAIKSAEKVEPVFCNCSAGFHKKDLEAIYGRRLKAEVLENALQGDLRCRFAIHLPVGDAKKEVLSNTTHLATWVEKLE